jgi:hypothetical protein
MDDAAATAGSGEQSLAAGGQTLRGSAMLGAEREQTCPASLMKGRLS